MANVVHKTVGKDMVDPDNSKNNANPPEDTKPQMPELAEEVLPDSPPLTENETRSEPLPEITANELTPESGTQPPLAEKKTIRSAAQAAEGKPAAKRKTLSLVIHDVGVLRAAYMQFVKGGGLFIPTKKSFTMGEDTNLIIKLLDDEEPYRVVARVVWITPTGSANGKAGGIGVEFAEDRNGEILRGRIEVILGPHLKSSESTHTM